MKRLNSALVALSVPMIALAVGCGDAGGGSTSAKADTSAASSAKPGPSAKTASAPASSGSAAAAKPAGETAPAPMPADAGATVKFMPKDCEERVFVNTGALVTGDVAKSLDALKGMVMSQLGGKPDADKAKKLDDAATANGLTMSSIRELAVCVGKDKKPLVAVAFDQSALKAPLADAIVNVMHAGSDEKGTRKDEDGVTYLTGEKPDHVMAVKGNILLAGLPMDGLKAATKGEGAADFADAAQNVIWIKSDKEGDQMMATVKAAGDNYDAKAVGMPDKKYAADWKADPKKAAEKMQADYSKEAEDAMKMPFLKPLEPAIKNLKVAPEGDKVAITTSFPRTALGEALSEMMKDPKNLGALMH